MSGEKLRAGKIGIAYEVEHKLEQVKRPPKSCFASDLIGRTQYPSSVWELYMESKTVIYGQKYNNTLMEHFKLQYIVG